MYDISVFLLVISKLKLISCGILDRVPTYVTLFAGPLQSFFLVRQTSHVIAKHSMPSYSGCSDHFVTARTLCHIWRLVTRRQ